MQFLRWPEYRTAKGMRDHDLIGDFDRKHGTPLGQWASG
jgi:hypothetical protein